MRPLKTTYLGQALVTATWIISPHAAFADYTPPIINSSLTDQQLNQGQILNDRSVEGQYYQYSADQDSSVDHEDAKAAAQDFNPQWDNLFKTLAANINSDERYNSYRHTLTSEENVVLPTILSASENSLDLKTLKENSKTVLNFNSNITGDSGFILRSSDANSPLLSLNGNNSYSGDTEVNNNAKLNIDGKLTNSSVVVKEGGEFSGRGLVKGLRVENGGQVFGFSRANTELTNPHLKNNNFQESYANSLIVDGDVTLEQGASASIRLGQPIISNGNITLNDNSLTVDLGNTVEDNGYYIGEVLVAKNDIVGKFSEIKTRNSLLTVEGIAVLNNHSPRLKLNNANLAAYHVPSREINAFERKLAKIAIQELKAKQALSALNNIDSSNEIKAIEKSYKTQALNTSIANLELAKKEVFRDIQEQSLDKLHSQKEQIHKAIAQEQSKENANRQNLIKLEEEIANIEKNIAELNHERVTYNTEIAVITINIKHQEVELNKIKEAYLSKGGDPKNLEDYKAIVLDNSLTSTDSTVATEEAKGKTLVVALKSNSALAAFEEENTDLLISEERDAASTIDDVRKAIPGLNTDVSLLSNKEIVGTAQLLFAPEYGQFISVSSTANRLARSKTHLSLLTNHDNTDSAVKTGFTYNGNLAGGGEHGLLSINQAGYFYNSGYHRFNAGFTFTKDSFKGTFSNVKNNVDGIGFYANYGHYLEDYNLLATAGISFNRYSGTIHRRGQFLAKAINLDTDYNSTLINLDLGLSQKYNFNLGSGLLTVAPFVGVGVTSNDAAEVHENFGDYSLNIEGGQQRAINARIGLKAEYHFNQEFVAFSSYTLDYSANNSKKVLAARVKELKGAQDSAEVKLHIKDKALLHALDFGVEYKVTDNFKASLHGEVLHRNGLTGGIGFKAEYSF